MNSGAGCFGEGRAFKHLAAYYFAAEGGGGGAGAGREQDAKSVVIISVNRGQHRRPFFSWFETRLWLPFLFEL